MPLLAHMADKRFKTAERNTLSSPILISVRLKSLLNIAYSSAFYIFLSARALFVRKA